MDDPTDLLATIEGLANADKEDPKWATHGFVNKENDDFDFFHQRRNKCSRILHSYSIILTKGILMQWPSPPELAHPGVFKGMNK